MRTLRIVLYAVNGSGVGHLTRLVAASRWVRRYASAAGVTAEIIFLTSSEADTMLFHERFASFKLPSKTAVADSGLDKTTYLALAKQWVWHSLGLLRPDLLVVDTFPRGSFGELLDALDLVKRRAFVYRPLKSDVGLRPDFQAMLPLYDAILVPEHEADARVVVPDSARAKLHYVGPVALRERVEMLSRAEVRRLLHVPDHQHVVYVSAGGGGDADAEKQLHHVASVLGADERLHLVIGAGPLYRGAPVLGRRVTFTQAQAVSEWMLGFDMAVSAAGYNTFTELMYAGVPAVFLPQPKIADEQAERASRAVAAGAGVMLGPSDDGVELKDAIECWLDPEARARASRAAQCLVPTNCAKELAKELLRLVLPASAVDRAESMVDDATLAFARAHDTDVSTLLDVMHALSPPDGERPADPGHLTELTAQIIEQGSTLGWAPRDAARVVDALSKKLASATADERASAAMKLLEALGTFADPLGATALLHTLASERRLSAARLTTELTSYLTRLRERGHDLHEGALFVSRARHGAAMPTNLELLEAATARCV